MSVEEYIEEALSAVVAPIVESTTLAVSAASSAALTAAAEASTAAAAKQTVESYKTLFESKLTEENASSVYSAYFGSLTMPCPRINPAILVKVPPTAACIYICIYMLLV